jgi:hypothetical protein
MRFKVEKVGCGETVELLAVEILPVQIKEAVQI